MLGTQHGHVSGKLKALIESPDFEVAAVCEPDKAALAKRKDDPLFKGIPWVSEGALLSDPSIQVVVVECMFWEALPWGKKVIDANKHLHLEKPPGTDLQAFRELVEAARKKNLLLQMGYVWRFHAGFQAAFEAARNGWLGDVYMLRGVIDKDLNPSRRATEWGKYKGGTFYLLVSHLIDLVVDFWGRPTAIKSWMRNDTIQDGMADNTIAVFDYPQGMAVLSSAAVMAGASQHRSFEVIGTNGSFVIRPLEPGNVLQVVMREPKGPYKAGWQEVEIPAQPRYVKDFQDLARALKTGEPLKYSYNHELAVQETLIEACEATG
jgi:predicted dehydrogenase